MQQSEDSVRTSGETSWSEVILLIDEYDVPLAKAFELGYYNSMTLLIRNLFENALKQ